MGWQYSEKTKKLFMDAVQGKTGTHSGEIANPDGVGEHGSVACGDALKFMFRVDRDPADPLKDKIVEAKFLTFGCTSAIAASEALCRIIEERALTPIESLKITNQDIVDYLEGLPTQKIHCSVMGAEALETAVFDWAAKRGVDMEALGIKRLNVDENEGRVVCACFGITEPYLRRKIKELGLRTVDEVTGAVKAGGACGSCRDDIQDIVNDVWANDASSEDCGCDDFDELAKDVLPSVELPSATESSEQLAKSSSESLLTVPLVVDGVVVEGSSFVSQPEKEDESFVDPRERYANASPYQRAKLIEKTIDEEVRPILRRDGGDIEIVDVKGNLVYVTLVGSCVNCDSASMTLEIVVTAALQELLDPQIQVIPV